MAGGPTPPRALQSAFRMFRWGSWGSDRRSPRHTVDAVAAAVEPGAEGGGRNEAQLPLCTLTRRPERGPASSRRWRAGPRPLGHSRALFACFGGGRGGATVAPPGTPLTQLLPQWSP